MSSLATCLASDPNLSCVLPDKFSPDGDIAGLGVFAAFSLAVFSSFVGALVVLSLEKSEYFAVKDSNRRRWYDKRISVTSFLVSLSDTQAVTTLALLISAYYFVGCTISAYHYDLVCTLVLMSSAAYIGSMIAIHMYFDTTWWLILFRAAMIVVNFVLAFRLFRRRSAIFPSSIPLSNIKSINRSFNTGLVLPATCFIDHPGVSNASNLHNFTASLSWTTNTTSPTSFNISSIHGNYNNSAPLTNATMPNFTLFASDDDTRSIGDQVALGLLSLAFILGALSSLFLFLSKRNQNPSGRSTVPATARSERQNHSPPGRQKFAFVLRCVSFIIANGVAFYGFVCFYKLWNWMNESRWFADGDDEKNVKSFGQLMPVLLLLLPILALMEQCADKDSSTHKNKIQKNETMSEA